MNPSNDGACFARLRANTGSATQRHLPATYWLDGREDGALSWNAAVTSRSFCQTKLQIIHKTRGSTVHKCNVMMPETINSVFIYHTESHPCPVENFPTVIGLSIVLSPLARRRLIIEY